MNFKEGKEEVGSLLRLFQSEYFTINMLIYYLNKKFTNEGINSYLINKLYSISDDEISEYITSLVYMSIIKESIELERYLFEKSAKNLNLYIKIFWTFNAFGHSSKKDKFRIEKMERLERCCEMSMVNGEVRENQSPPMSFDLQSIDEEMIFRRFQEKEARLNYNTSLMKFVNNLIKISLLLKTITEENRNSKLRDYMYKTNIWLSQIRTKYREESKLTKNNKEAYYLFEGMIIPFEIDEDNPSNSNMIVRINENECKVFNTRKRVPYKIVVETISMQDLLYYTPKNIKNINSKSFNQKDWDFIDGNVGNFDIWDQNLAIDSSNEINKYQGLNNFAKYVEQNEKSLYSYLKTTSNLTSINSPLRRKAKPISNFPKENPTMYSYSGKEIPILNSNKIKESVNSYKNKEIPGMNSYNGKEFSKDSKEYGFIQKLNNFNMVFPSYYLTRRNSEELRLEIYRSTKILKKDKSHRLSLQEIAPFNNIVFLDHIIHELVTNDYKDKRIEKLREIKLYIQDFLKHMIDEPSPWINHKKVRSFGPWGKIWEDEMAQIQHDSPYGHFPSYKIRSLIVKGGDDLRQELIAMKMIERINKIFKRSKLNIYLRPYEIIVTSANSGIIEFIPNTLSIDELKKKNPQYKTLFEFYKDVFSFHFEEAQKNFIESLAGYSLVSYLLNIKDRHNGNLLIDNHGHLIHIDFGFILNFSPGGITFESAPFKLTSEYVELMGGKESNMFIYFKLAILKGFLELRKHCEDILYMIHILAEESELPCFENLDFVALKAKFMENCTDKEVMDNIEKLIEISLDNWRTIQYDNFQKISNGIL